MRKNWKNRYFVAYNAADNWVVRYYTEEVEAHDSAKHKGDVHLCWYRCLRVEKEEELTKLDAKFALKLKPYWTYDRRRIWYLKFESEEELKEWQAVLETACSKSRAPLNEDAIMRAAFQAAYRQCRWALGVWGWYDYYDTEQQMLANMIVDRCNASIMPPVYAKVSGRMAYRVRRIFESQLDTTVGAAVQAAWKAVVKAINESKGKVREEVDKLIGPILDKQVEFKDQLVEKLADKINPALAETVAPKLKSIVDVLSQPLERAQRAAINMWKEETMKALSEAGGDKAKVLKELEDLDRACRWWYGKLWPAFDAIRDLTRAESREDNAAKGAAIAMVLEDVGGMSMWQLEDALEDNVRFLARSAVYTMKSCVDKHGMPVDESTMNAVLAAYAEDAKSYSRQTLHDILFNIFSGPIEKAVWPLIDPVITPLDEAIPEPMKMLLDIKDLASQVISDTLSSAVFAVVDPSATEPTLSKLLDLAPAGTPELPPAPAVAPPPKQVTDKDGEKHDEDAEEEAAAKAEEKKEIEKEIADEGAAAGGSAAAAATPKDPVEA